MNTQALQQSLIDSYALAIKTQNYHWNITGPNFSSLHLLFEAQYNDLNLAIDLIAERIRAKGEKVASSLDLFNKQKMIGNPISGSANDLLKDLAQEQKIILKSLHQALKIAQEESDEASADLLIERITSHEKNHWMLESNIQN
jgi:starvation-inducible DNA-binding protein